VAYRDENEALRSRVRELERELAASEGRVQRLLGKSGAPKRAFTADSIVGEAVHRVDEVTLDAPLDDAGLDAIQRVVEARLGHAVVREGRELRGTRIRLAALADRSDGAFALTTNEHGTWLRLESDLGRLPIVVPLGPVLGVLTSLPLIVWQMHRLHHFQPAVGMGFTMTVLVVSMILATVVVRAFAKRLARRAREAHDGAWATVLELARDHALPRARVEVIAEEPTHEASDEPEAAQRSTR
jgi:hypothetical protein